METTITEDRYETVRKEHLNMGTHALDLTKGLRDDAQYRIACDFLLKIKERRKWWSDMIYPAVKAAHEAHKKIKDLEKEIDSPLAKAENEILKPAIVKYENEQENKRRIEQERINRELQKQEEERRLQMAQELAESGKHEQADQVLEMPEQAPQIVLPKTTEHKGISYRMAYSADVFDVKALCRAVAEGKIEATYVAPNFGALNSLARSLKEAMNPQWEQYGVKVKSEKIIAAGGR